MEYLETKKQQSVEYEVIDTQVYVVERTKTMLHDWQDEGRNFIFFIKRKRNSFAQIN